MKKLIYLNCQDEDIGYMTAYYSDIIKTKFVYIIPFIDISISNEISKSGRSNTFIDMAYLVFKNYNIINCEFYGYNETESTILYSILGKTNNKNHKEFTLGADNFNATLLNRNNQFDSGCSWEIECETFMLQLLESSKTTYGTFGFTPFDMPNLKSNMDLQDSINFMKNKYLPENLKNLIKNDKPQKIYEIYEKQKIVTEPFII